MIRAFAAAALVALTVGPAWAGFEEFDNPTVDFDRPHTLRAGVRLCSVKETIDDPHPSGCRTLRRPTKVTAKYVIHGFSQPQFWVEPVDDSPAGWVYRGDIVD